MSKPTEEQILEAIIEAGKNRSIKCPYCGGLQIEEQDCGAGMYHRFRCASCGRMESITEKDGKAINAILGSLEGIER